jgi:hypothetical protein
MMEMTQTRNGWGKARAFRVRLNGPGWRVDTGPGCGPVVACGGRSSTQHAARGTQLQETGLQPEKPPSSAAACAWFQQECAKPTISARPPGRRAVSLREVLPPGAPARDSIHVLINISWTAIRNKHVRSDFGRNVWLCCRCLHSKLRGLSD